MKFEHTKQTTYFKGHTYSIHHIKPATFFPAKIIWLLYDCTMELVV